MIEMHAFHKLIYDAMSSIVNDDKPIKTSMKMIKYLATEKYIEVNDFNDVNITKKGLILLGRLEEFKHNDLSRVSTWIGLVITGTLSLFATIISLIALYGGN